MNRLFFSRYLQVLLDYGAYGIPSIDILDGTIGYIRIYHDQPDFYWNFFIDHNYRDQRISTWYKKTLSVEEGHYVLRSFFEF